MITVRIRGDTLSVSGHANYGPKGYDIVCASASMLISNLIESIESLTDDIVTYLMSDGQFEMKYKDLSEQSKLLTDSFFIGFTMLAREYPDYVTID